MGMGPTIVSSLGPQNTLIRLWFFIHGLYSYDDSELAAFKLDTVQRSTMSILLKCTIDCFLVGASMGRSYSMQLTKKNLQFCEIPSLNWLESTEHNDTEKKHGSLIQIRILDM